jgi:L-threonylcarbamoyladenylate synthase
LSEIERAARALVEGHLVAMPTETVYGLAADANNASAVDRIFEVKGRPRNHPLILHIASRDQIDDWAIDMPDFAIALAEAFWPGPMTLVLKRSTLAQDFITGGQSTVGVRVPNHPVALELLDIFERLGGKGIAAPSANRFGQVSPTTVSAVRAELADRLTNEDIILEGGESRVGLESTIIDCTGDNPAILRPGAITVSMIEQVTGLPLSAETDPTIRVSGSLKSHYAPNASVVLDTEAKAGEGLIALAGVATPIGVTRLAAPKNLEEYAHQLYAALRKADELGLSRIAAIQPEGDGLAIAIRDRLQRAAHR